MEQSIYMDFAEFIAKMGARGAKFLLCMGEEFIFHCVGEVLKCTWMQDTVECLKVLTCEAEHLPHCINIFLNGYGLQNLKQAQMNRRMLEHNSY